MNRHSSARRTALLMGLAAACAVACRPREEIRTYTVESPSAQASAEPAGGPAAPPPAERGEPTDRMVAAMAPAADRAWFLKIVGPIAAVASADPPVEAFLASVRVDDGRPVWELPEGWTERPASGMRLATLVVPVAAPTRELELSVIGLPRVGDWPAQLRDNANRWRGQLGRDPLPADNYADADPDAVVLFDETGWFEGGSMTPPFAGRGAAPPAVGAPPIAPPPAGGRPAKPAASELTYSKPDGWTDKPGSAMRKASFATAGGAEVTAFAFPAGAPALADPLANVNRWRGEVGLDPTSAEALAAESEQITLAGTDATYIEIVGEAETTYAAMTKRGSRVWFFKLRGASDAVAAERGDFRAWLDSIQIAGGP